MFPLPAAAGGLFADPPPPEPPGFPAVGAPPGFPEPPPADVIVLNTELFPGA